MVNNGMSVRPGKKNSPKAGRSWIPAADLTIRMLFNNTLRKPAGFSICRVVL